MSERVPKLLVLAGGGHAAEVNSYLLDLEMVGTSVRLLGIIDEVLAPGPWEGSFVLGDYSVVPDILRVGHSPLYYITAVGSNDLRRKLVARASSVGLTNPWVLRHPSSNVGRRVEIGAGTLLAPGCIVTTRVQIGLHCLLNVKSSVSHDCTLGDFVNINPGATLCGSVHIGAGAFVGAGAVIKNGVRIGEGAVIGAGAVVVSDIPDNVTAVGVPARVLRPNPRPWQGTV